MLVVRKGTEEQVVRGEQPPDSKDLLDHSLAALHLLDHQGSLPVDRLQARAFHDAEVARPHQIAHHRGSEQSRELGARTFVRSAGATDRRLEHRQGRRTVRSRRPRLDHGDARADLDLEGHRPRGRLGQHRVVPHQAAREGGDVLRREAGRRGRHRLAAIQGLDELVEASRHTLVRDEKRSVDLPHGIGERRLHRLASGVPSSLRDHALRSGLGFAETAVRPRRASRRRSRIPACLRRGQGTTLVDPQHRDQQSFRVGIAGSDEFLRAARRNRSSAKHRRLELRATPAPHGGLGFGDRRDPIVELADRRFESPVEAIVGPDRLPSHRADDRHVGSPSSLGLRCRDRAAPGRLWKARHDRLAGEDDPHVPVRGAVSHGANA